MAEFTAGQEVKVKAGMFRRKGAVMIPRHSIITLTEDDLKRSDLDLLVTSVDEPLQEFGGANDKEAEIDGTADTGLNPAGDLSVEELTPILSNMTVPQAKKLLDTETWTLENMQMALSAEQDGKNRETLTDYIEDRILDLEDGN